MTQKIFWPVKVLFLGILFVRPSESAVFSKQEAYALLRAQGFKWNQIQTMAPEAESKTAAAASEFRPRFQLGFRQYLARINPIQYGAAETQTLDTVGFGTTALELTWSLMDSLAKAKLLTAEANEKMTSAQAKHLENELTALMLIQYLNAQRLKKQLDMMDAALKKSQLILSLVTTKKSVGAGIPLEVARAKNLLQLDQLKKISTMTRYLKARRELALLLGKEELPEDFEILSPQVMTIENLQEASSASLKNRSDLKSAEAAMVAAELARSEAGKIIFPKLTLFSEVGTTQPSILGFPAKTMNGFIGLSLSIPLESGGLIDAKRREAALVMQKAHLQKQQIQAEIHSQVKESMEQLAAAEEALKASADYLKTAQEEADIASQRYKLGSSTVLDLTTAHANLATAVDTRVENIFNYEAARVGYFRAHGDFQKYFSLSPNGPNTSNNPNTQQKNSEETRVNTQ